MQARFKRNATLVACLWAAGAGCAESPVTGVRLSLVYDQPPRWIELRGEAGTGASFGPTRLPESEGGLDPGGDRVVILVPDALDQRSLRIGGTALDSSEQVMARGETRVTVRAGVLVEASLRITGDGDPATMGEGGASPGPDAEVGWKTDAGSILDGAASETLRAREGGPAQDTSVSDARAPANGGDVPTDDGTSSAADGGREAMGASDAGPGDASGGRPPSTDAGAARDATVDAGTSGDEPEPDSEAEGEEQENGERHEKDDDREDDDGDHDDREDDESDCDLLCDPPRGGVVNCVHGAAHECPGADRPHPASPR